MTTWICDPCGPIPASEVEGITHDSPHGQERHTVCDSDLVVLGEVGRSSGPRQDHRRTKDHRDRRNQIMTNDPNDDPRTGVHIPAGASMLEAAAAVQVWLHDNASTNAAERAQFVVELDGLMCDYDFTLACVKGLVPGLPDVGGVR